MVTFPLSPLMHGGAQAGLLMHLFAGHLTILEPKFDPVRTWEIIEREKRPADLHDRRRDGPPADRGVRGEAATGTPYDCPNLFAVSSSAAIFSPPVKERWMAAFPNSIFTDSVGATETGFQGMGMQDKDNISSDGPVVGARARAASSSTRTTTSSTRPPTSARSAGSAAAAGAGRLLQGPREVRRDVPRDRRRALLGARRLRPDRGGRQGHAARPRLQLRQHRRREGLPRRGRDGDQGPPGRLRRARGRRPRREVRPGGRRGRRAARGRDARARGAARPSCATTSPATSCRARSRSSTQIPRNATGKAQYPAAKELALAAFAAKHPTTVV